MQCADCAVRMTQVFTEEKFGWQNSAEEATEVCVCVCECVSVRWEAEREEPVLVTAAASCAVSDQIHVVLMLLRKDEGLSTSLCSSLGDVAAEQRANCFTCYR